MKKIVSLLVLLIAASCLFTSCKKDKLVWDFPYQYDLSKYIEITKEDYVGIQYSTYDVGEEEIYAEIQSLLDKHAIHTEITDRPAQNGDYINIDYTGYLDGVAFENGAAKGEEFVLGEANFISGFQEGIVGHSTGETFTIDATFPADYGVESLNGKTVQFEMTLNKIETISYPSLTDSFISENTEFDTFQAYYQNVKEELEAKASSSAVVQQKNEAFETICNNVKILDYPEDEYQAYYSSVLTQYVTLAQESGQTLEQYITAQGATMDDFYAYVEQYVQSSISTELVFFAIANNENILTSLTQADYDNYLKDIATEYLSTPEDFEKMNGEEAIWKSLVWDKVMDFVLANGQAVSDSVNLQPEINVEQLESSLNDAEITPDETVEVPDESTQTDEGSNEESAQEITE